MDLEKIKPKALKKGNCLGIIAPASQTSTTKFSIALKNIEKLGFKIKLSQNVSEKNGFLAGNDVERLADIHTMFQDDDVDGIMCLRGGYGTGRLLNDLDYELIRSNPKPFIGFSDITALMSAFMVKAGLVVFHGPVATSTYTDFTYRSLLSQLSIADSLPIPIRPGFTPRTDQGIVEGEVVGGNLAILTSLIGTPYDVDYANKIVVIEDVGEAPYKIDRMLTHMINAGRFEQAAAVVFGIFENCENQSQDPDELTYLEVIEERMGVLNVPFIHGLQFGHTDDNATLPLGIKARLDFEGLTLSYLEKAVLC